ncbi:MAG: hypothetical protein GY870_17985 [archaeon]|nr:hypothetical protein [archaeon]
MIDREEEEEIEEILKKKFNWKSFLKGTLSFIFMGIAYLSIFYTSLGFFGIILMCFASLFMISLPKKKNVVRQTLSRAKCENCGVQLVRDFKDGDFVFKKVGYCSKCSNPLIIFDIYSVKLKEKEDKNKKN